VYHNDDNLSPSLLGIGDRFIDSIVGNSSNSVEIGGAALMLSPDATVNVAAAAARSAVM